MKESLLSQSDRPDGRFLTTAGFIQHTLKNLEPALAFKPGLSLKTFAAWKRKVRAKLRELMAFPAVPPQPRPKLVWEKRREGYRLQRWELYPEPFSVVPFLMLAPDTATPSSRAPAVLCFPGSDQPKESLAGERWKGPWKAAFGECDYMALHYARQGFVALAFDNPSTCELADKRSPDWRRQVSALLWLNRPYECLSTFQKFQALQWLKTVPFVDARRIAVSGFSLGAKPALLLGILDPAVKAVIWNSGAPDWREREVVQNLHPMAPWQYIPGFIRWFDYSDLMAALAPTPLLVTEGGPGAAHRRIRQAYAIAGAPGGFKVTFCPSYAKASARRYYHRKIPEGVSEAMYRRHACYDGYHCFKPAVAVPWLRRLLG